MVGSGTGALYDIPASFVLDSPCGAVQNCEGLNPASISSAAKVTLEEMGSLSLI